MHCGAAFRNKTKGDVPNSVLQYHCGLSKHPRQKHSPPGHTCRFSKFSGGEWLCLGHLLSDESWRISLMRKTLRMTFCTFYFVVLLTPRKQVIILEIAFLVENFDNHEVKMEAFHQHPTECCQVEIMNKGCDQETANLENIGINRRTKALCNVHER